MLRGGPSPRSEAALDGVIVSAPGPLDAGGPLERFRDRVAVVIPACDEASNLPELVSRMPASVGGVPVAVLVVDDGSGDLTGPVALAAGAVVARLPVNLGGGAALRAGYALMIAAGARVVVTMDADGQHRPEDLAAVAGPLLADRCDFVQGSRVIGHAESGPLTRKLGIVFFNRLLRALLDVRVTDCSNSFRAVRTELLAELDLREAQFHAAEFLIEALTRGCSYEEVPVTVVRRRSGTTKKPAALRYGVGFARAIVAASARARSRARAGSEGGGDRGAGAARRRAVARSSGRIGS